MPKQSLFKACKNRCKVGASGTESVGDNTVSFEYYTQADIDANVVAIKQGEATKCTFGDSDESKVVLVVGDSITVPSGFNLTPANPKKSLIIFCNTFVNNGTVSMTAKGPNVLPHDYLILSRFDNYGEPYDINIPAYADNGVPAFSKSTAQQRLNGYNGNAGTNRQCGSGGQGNHGGGIQKGYIGASGSGSAFAGGAGSGGGYSSANNVDTTYPMRGSDGVAGAYAAEGGVGNPSGATITKYSVKNVVGQNTGVGGRVIIYCGSFENNGTISADGVATQIPYRVVDGWCNNYGGASGGGAIDIFYYTLTTEGTITANGGNNFSRSTGFGTVTPGKGGNGCVTLLNWEIEQVIREERKMFSEGNWCYLFENYVDRLKEDEAL